MRSYNFERFLHQENSEGYRLSVLNILAAYVDKRRTFKTTIGSNQGSKLDLED